MSPFKSPSRLKRPLLNCTPVLNWCEPVTYDVAKFRWLRKGPIRPKVPAPQVVPRSRSVLRVSTYQSVEPRGTITESFEGDVRNSVLIADKPSSSISLLVATIVYFAWLSYVVGVVHFTAAVSGSSPAPIECPRNL